MQWDDDIGEEDYVLVSQGYGESTNNTRQNIKQFGGTIEFVVLVDQGKEALIHRLSNHFSSRYEFGVQLVENVLKIISLDGFFGVEELKELLDELRSYINLERSNLDGLVDNQLEEEFVDALKMRPGWINFILGFHTGFRKG